MKRANVTRILALAALAFAPALPLLAADAGVKLDAPVAPDKNRFGISYRAGFNFTAEFKNVGNSARRKDPARDPGPATGDDVDRFYDNGYNRVRTGDNFGGFTWFWGYNGADQIITANDTIEMKSTTSRRIDSTSHDDDPQHGFELTWDRELGRAKSGKWAWGVEGAFGWTDIEIRDHRTLRGGTVTLIDAFDLGGLNPVPPAGHAGTFDGPGPQIDSSPERRFETSASGTTVRGQRDFDGDLFSFRAGPYIDLPLDERWTISLSAGFAAGIIEGRYEFDETVTIENTTTSQRGRGHNTDVLFGGYLSGTIHCKINDDWGVFVNGQYLGLAGTYEASANGQKIQLDLTRTAFFSAGVTYSF